MDLNQGLMFEAEYYTGVWTEAALAVAREARAARVVSRSRCGRKHFGVPAPEIRVPLTHLRDELQRVPKHAATASVLPEWRSEHLAHRARQIEQGPGAVSAIRGAVHRGAQARLQCRELTQPRLGLRRPGHVVH
jgi:hypothetical protein